MAVRTKTGHTRATRDQILRFDVNLKKEEAAFPKRGRLLLLVLVACVSFFWKGPLLRVSQGGGDEACYVSSMEGPREWPMEAITLALSFGVDGFILDPLSYLTQFELA